MASLSPASTDDQPASATDWMSVARGEVRQFMTPKPVIFWADYIGSVAIGYVAAATYLALPFGTWQSLTTLLVAALATYRAAMFLHEIVHFRHNQMTAFKWFWNITGGIIMLMPSFLYESHLSHHSSHHYGTNEDGEYLPLGRGTLLGLLAFLGQCFVLPIFVYLRFLVGTPVSFAVGAIRKWIVEHASSFVIDFRYRRRIKEQLSPLNWVMLEWACWLRAAIPVIAIYAGLMPWTRLTKLYLLAVVAILINHLRTLAAHRYRSDGRPMGHDEQFLDSTNIRGGWLTGLLCPVGLRYHALHHLFPAIPYHNLAAAHAHLVNVLPEESRYRETEYTNYGAVIAELLRQICARRKRT